MSFLFPLLFWVGLPMIALPVIIHLLNLRRQRKVPWAAMQFLLQSEQQSKTWITFQELLLMLLRMAVVALLVCLLAHPTVRSSWFGPLWTRPVHHLVLLDDSYSMSDQWGGGSAWQQAQGAVQDILRAAAEQSRGSMITLLPFSELRELTDDPRPAIFRRPLEAATRQELASRIDTLQPSELSVDLVTALRQAVQLADQQSVEQDFVVHLVSDFRQRDFAVMDEVTTLFRLLEEKAEHLECIRCVRQVHPNLAITLLEPISGTRAADVEVEMRVVVENYGLQPVREVVVELTQDGQPLVAVPVGDLPAQERAERQFRTRFAGTGPHSLQASLEADAVLLDNQRYYATNLPEAQQVLLVDGSPHRWESYYVATAIAPGGAVQSGWQPKLIAPAALRREPLLEKYAVIALLDVPRLTAEDQQRLRQYVEQGGGLYLTMGESIEPSFYQREAFAQGQGWCPAPPELPTQWLAAAGNSQQEATTADLRVMDHPLFRVFRGERNSMLALMKVNYYYSLAQGWRSLAASDTRVLASLANGTPLVLEKSLGRGRVIQQLSKVSPDQGRLGSWSNWGTNPAFVVFANELMGYLASGQGADLQSEVGEVLRRPVEEGASVTGGRMERQGAGAPYQAALQQELLGEQLMVVSPAVPRAGLYRLETQLASGATAVAMAAVNPAAEEGQLELMVDSTLRQKLSTDKVTFRFADELTVAADRGSSGWSEMLLTMLVLVLVAEQALAYVCSFHE